MHIMQYKPPLVSATPRMEFGAPGYSATLLSDIRTTGVTRYAYLLVVYGPSPNEPLLIVSSEVFAGGPDTVLGVFDDNGHETLYNESGGWKDETKFAAKAVVIANERLKTDLRKQVRHSHMTTFTCSTCGKEWPENYCPECARTIDRSRAAPEPGTRGVPAAPARDPMGRNRAMHSRQMRYPAEPAAGQDPIIGKATPRRCSCGGTLWPTGAQFKVSRSMFGTRTGDVVLTLECSRCPKEIQLPEPKMVVAAAFLFPLMLALLLGFLGLELVPALHNPRSEIWGYPIIGLFLAAGCCWIGSILYQGTVNRLRYPPQTTAVKQSEGEMTTLYGNPAAATKPQAFKAAAIGSENYTVPDLGSIRAQRRLRRSRRQAKLIASACLLIAVCCVGYQTSANRERRMLLEIGHRTQGRLENVTITRYLPLFFWWPSRSFDVWYVDDAGAPHRKQMDVSAEVFKKNTLANNRFTHHSIEVAFLPHHPDVVGLPEALGSSVWGYVIAVVPLLIGFALFRSRQLHASNTLRKAEKGPTPEDARIAGQSCPSATGPPVCSFPANSAGHRSHLSS